jgi:hypothetical protein
MDRGFVNATIDEPPGILNPLEAFFFAWDELTKSRARL